MENIIHVGAKIDKEDATNFASAITKIFDSAHENHMDQATVKKAISAFARIFEVKEVAITGSNFVGEDKRVFVNSTDDE